MQQVRVFILFPTYSSGWYLQTEPTKPQLVEAGPAGQVMIAFDGTDDFLESSGSLNVRTGHSFSTSSDVQDSSDLGKYGETMETVYISYAKQDLGNPP